MFIKIKDHVLRIDNIERSYYDRTNQVLKVFYRNGVVGSIIEHIREFEFKLDEYEYDMFLNDLFSGSCD